MVYDICPGGKGCKYWLIRCDGCDAHPFRVYNKKENTMPTNEQIRDAADRHTDAECALRELHPDAFEETFNSNQDNMSIADNHEGSYKIGTTWGVCKIKDGMLYLHLSVGHDGIKTDSQGRILIHPDSK